MSKSDDNLFVVKGDHSLQLLPDFLQARAYDQVKHGLRDRKGAPMIGLKLKSRDVGLILIPNAELEPSAIQYANDFVQA